MTEPSFSINFFSRATAVLMLVALLSPSDGSGQVADTNTVVISQQETDSSQNLVFSRTVEASVIDSLKNDRDFLYANDPEYWKKEEAEESNGFLESFVGFLSSRAVRVVFFAALIGIAVFVIYRIIAVNGMFSSMKRKQSLQEVEPLLRNTRESIEEDLQQAMDSGNLREAVRLLHLRTLYLLDSKNLLSFDPQFTNDVYIRQLSETNHKSEFTYLTRIYEYVFYGDFAVTNLQFASIRSSFEDFKNKLHA